MGAVLTYMGGALSDKLGFLKTVRLGNLIFLAICFSIYLCPKYMGLLRCYDTEWPLAYSHNMDRLPYSVKNTLLKNAGFASGITLGLGITLGGLVAPYIGHLADIYDVQTALMTLIPVGLMGLLMSLWLKEPK